MKKGLSNGTEALNLIATFTFFQRFISKFLFNSISERHGWKKNAVYGVWIIMMTAVVGYVYVVEYVYRIF